MTNTFSDRWVGSNFPPIYRDAETAEKSVLKCVTGFESICLKKNLSNVGCDEFKKPLVLQSLLFVHEEDPFAKSNYQSTTTEESSNPLSLAIL